MKMKDVEAQARLGQEQVEVGCRVQMALLNRPEATEVEAEIKRLTMEYQPDQTVACSTGRTWGATMVLVWLCRG